MYTVCIDTVCVTHVRQKKEVTWPVNDFICLSTVPRRTKTRYKTTRVIRVGCTDGRHTLKLRSCPCLQTWYEKISTIAMFVHEYRPRRSWVRPYFKLKHDDVDIAGFSSIQKCTADMRMLAYRAPADTHDDYLRMSESTTIECMYKFCRAVVGKFGILKMANWRRDCKDHGTKWCERILWNDWKHRLRALVMEELPVCLTRYIQRVSWILQCRAWSCGRLWPVNLAFFLSHGGITQ
jgi:hypothetical protein